MKARDKVISAAEGPEATPIPADQEEFTFAVFGDPQMLNDITRRIIDQVAQEDAAFCLILGDLIGDADDETHWVRFQEMCRPLRERFPVYTVPGNHDYQREGRMDYYRTYAQPGDLSYSFSHGGCRVLMLDALRDGVLWGTLQADEGAFPVGSAQYAWLEQGLMSAFQAGETTFVGLHHPIFMDPSMYSSTAPTIRVDETVQPPRFGNLLPLLAKYDVQMAFGGHIHVYEHCVYKDIDFVTTGATGFELYRPEGTVNGYRVRAEARYHYCRVRVSAERIVLEAIDIEGEVFDCIERRRKRRAASTYINPS